MSQPLDIGLQVVQMTYRARKHHFCCNIAKCKKETPSDLPGLLFTQFVICSFLV